MTGTGNGSPGFKISHDEDGTPYVRAYLGTSPATGKPMRRYRRFPGMTDAEAERAARAWLAELAEPSPKLGDMLARYVERLGTDERSPNTLRTYRLYARRYAHTLRGRTLAEITPVMLDRLFTELRARGPKGGKPLSAVTVKKFRAFLKGAFRYFVSQGLVESNPVDGTPPIRATSPEAHALDAEDVATLADALETELDGTAGGRRATKRRNAALGIMLSLYTGMRVGEVCALRRRDVDTRNGIITVCGNVTEAEGKPRRAEQTKGKRTRRVAIDQQTAEAIREHERWQDGYLAHADRNTPLLTVDGDCMRPSSLSRQFSNHRKALGLDPSATFHTLRHTHATMLLQDGTDMRTVQERLGHAQVGTTLGTYAHVMPGRDKEAATRFSALMGRES